MVKEFDQNKVLTIKPSEEKEYYNWLGAGSEFVAIFSGSQKCPPMHKREGIRYHFLTHYILDGEGIFETRHQVYCLKRGMAFTIFPEKNYCYCSSKENPWTYVWVGFLGTKARMVLRKANISEENPVFKAEFSKQLEINFGLLNQCLADKKNGYEIKAEAYLYHILAEMIELSEVIPSKTPDLKEECIEKAIQFMGVNFQNPITVEQIAEFLGYHPTYFSSFFKKEIGLSPQQYLVNFRMQKAREMLANTTLSIGQIAFSVGYSDYFAFAKRFHMSEKCTPTEYRIKNVKKLSSRNTKSTI